MRSLNIPVREIMKSPVYLGEDDTVAHACSVMAEKGISSILVAEEGVLRGIFTERDLSRVIAEGRDISSTLLGEVMTPSPITLSPEDSVIKAIETMFERKIRHLPVTEEGRLVGIVSQTDLLRFLKEACL